MPGLPDGQGSSRAGFSPASRVLITLAATTVAIVGLHLGRELIGPFAVGALVVLVAHPVRFPLERRGVPSAVATAAVIAVAYLILIVIGALVVVAVAQFVALLPSYADQFNAAERQVTETLSSLGFSADSAAQTGRLLNPEKLIGVAAAISSGVLGAGTSFFFVFAYIVFMAADAAGFSGMAERFAATKADVIGVLARYVQSVRRYLAVNTVFGAIVAALDGVVLVMLGLPAPVLWVILAFVTNYIPNIGFVIALVPPALLALLTGGWGPALTVVVAYCVINLVMQTFIQPKFVSDAVRLSLTLTFASVLFWGVILGPIGAVLAIPVTLFLRALLLETDPDASWARWVTGDRAEPSTD
ncbi:MAG: AI-2E family transporter [Microlunatus sp.]|nr:AI-2E family transporter [Microlunatus sp.]MDN5803144.1 AI-2E family transporter [Microlunatus sp.]